MPDLPVLTLLLIPLRIDQLVGRLILKLQVQYVNV